MMKQWIVWILLLLTAPFAALAQGERLAPMRWNPRLATATAPRTSNAKKAASAISLPFFEDFTGYDLFPSSARWSDSEVYINNTMCANPISRGVATFDALNRKGRPY